MCSELQTRVNCDQKLYRERCRSVRCRSCGVEGLLPILDLGAMPLADGLRSLEQLEQPEPRYPLEVGFCDKCSLVQITETVSPELLFCRDYPYYSSFSESVVANAQSNVLNLIESRRLDHRNAVLEIASNDGYLLRYFVARGIPVLGVDPAEGPAKAAQKTGVPTRCAFFGKDLAAELASEGKKFDVVLANNVLAHVADTNGLVEGIGMVLKDSGVAVLEVPYLRDLVDNCEFDTIYHEHLCYFSVTAADRLFRRHGLFLNNIGRLPIHGGSIRLYVELLEDVKESVVSILEQEKILGLNSYQYFRDFGLRVKWIRGELRDLLSQIKSANKCIAAYAAAAKGSVLLNYVELGTDTICFVADRNVHKQGKFMPGVHIPICGPERLLKDRPDYTLLLAWNHKDEIVRQQADYRRKGGQFIIPIPEPRILSNHSSEH